MLICPERRFIFIKSAKCAGTSIEMFLAPQLGETAVVTPFHHPEAGHGARNFSGVFNPFPELRHLGRDLRGVAGAGSTPKLKHTLNDLRWRRRFYEAQPAWQLRARMGAREFDSYFSFAFERNPWEKVLSRVDHLNALGSYDFEITIDWLLNRLEGVGASTYSQLAPVNFPRYADPTTNRVLVTKICRYELLNDELREVFGNLGIEFGGRLPALAKVGYRTDKRHYRQRLTAEQAERIAVLFDREVMLMDYEW